MIKTLFPHNHGLKSRAIAIHLVFWIAIVLVLVPGYGQAVQTVAAKVATITNGNIILTVTAEGKKLLHDSIRIVEKKTFGFFPVQLSSDGDFAIDLIWTGWIAPGMANNSQNRVMLTKKDFEVLGLDTSESQGEKRIIVTLKGINSTLMVTLSYSLGATDYFVRRSVRIFDTTFGHHFLHVLHPVKAILTFANIPVAGQEKVQIREEGSEEYAEITAENSIPTFAGVQVVKAGAYGQVAAIRATNGSAFFGLEHPASENLLKPIGNNFVLDCSRPFGVLIDATGITSEAVVLAVNPEPYVRKWYWNYIDTIRVALAEPYTLYNSWYDLRSVEYPRVPEAHWMNQENIARLVDKVNQNMTVKNGIKVDAFVLDDGWDVYKSDWVLRQAQFPNGLKPIAEKLATTDTKLGIWFGPIGGYSFRMQRIEWMMQHGYEGINREYEYCGAFLCIGGEKYNGLFRTRIDEMIKNHGVRYFKWDGIIFSCNEPNHGHRTGIYSPVSILEQFGKVCREARQAAPDVFLNITTGTWLSPWWLGYANQIWMDGSDYAFANVPSVSKRDNAITYRDFVLYDDFKKKDLWFPVANLMTHGLIKGKLDHVGTNNEPLDKLTDDAVLYVARGVSMYELYISPDILTAGEWSAIAGALRWARDRHPVLSRTEMIGGNPTLGEPYGYAHFVGTEGIVAVRNPGAKPQTIQVELSPELGINRFAVSLVMERVYPYRYIAPELYSAGATIAVELEGFETAVFEIYPLAKATLPLVAGAVFSERMNSTPYNLDILGKKAPVKILNPELLKGTTIDLSVIPPLADDSLRLVSFSQKVTPKGLETLMDIDVPATIQNAEVGFLFNNPDGVKVALPNVLLTVNNKTVAVRGEDQKESWGWRMVDVKPGRNTIVLLIPKEKGVPAWLGSIEVWNFGFQAYKSRALSFPEMMNPVLRPMPPSPWPQGTMKRTVLMKSIQIK